MSYRRVKSIAYEDDDYDDYDDGDDVMTDHDREQLTAGTRKVREALDTTFPASDKEIQDALWEYYYDVGKSVTYLKNRHQSKTPQGAKRKGTNQQAVNALKQITTACNTAFSVRDFFKDAPWLGVPKNRQALIHIQPVCPRLRLLGGSSSSSKTSRLAALAAKRREKDSTQMPATVDKTGTASSSRSPPASVKAPSPNADLNLHVADLRLSGTAQSTSDWTWNHNKENTFSNISDLRAMPSMFAETLLQSSEARPSFESFNEPGSVHGTKVFDFTGPSPDDVVMKAQTGKATNTRNEDKSVKNNDEVSPALATLTIQKQETIKSKNIDVAAEYQKKGRKNAANFVVIGHVDSGKSTLMGRLLYDLGAIDKETINGLREEAEEAGKGSFAFAWVLDQGSEERAHGVTTDVAIEKFETEKTNFTILDAPGHRDFVPKMIAGTSQADFAVLVIDSLTGEFEAGLRGQTKEHALLARSIGVQRIIVAVNKMDAAEWSQDRFQEIRQQMTGFLTILGFQDSSIPFVPCSGLLGENVLSPTKDSRASWYTGPTLVEELDDFEPQVQAIEKPLRMTIDNVEDNIAPTSAPLSITGRLETGSVQLGQDILIMPTNFRTRVKSLDDGDSQPRDWAVAGDNVTLHLTDNPNDDDAGVHVVKAGHNVYDAMSRVQNVRSLTAKVLTFAHMHPMFCEVLRGRFHAPGKIAKMVETLDKSSGEVLKKRPKIVHPGTVVRVVVELDEPGALEVGDRIVLRSSGETIATGMME